MRATQEMTRCPLQRHIVRLYQIARVNRLGHVLRGKVLHEVRQFEKETRPGGWSQLVSDVVSFVLSRKESDRPLP
jgi:hypothetical protein